MKENSGNGRSGRVRSTVKALVTHDGRILLNRNRDEIYGDYYALPGGGQKLYEPAEDAVRRECLEETGYAVRPLRLAAVFESIRNDEKYISLYPDVTHKLILVFRCELTGEPLCEPTELDSNQLGCEWIEISRLGEVNIQPALVRERISDMLETRETLFLGVNRK